MNLNMLKRWYSANDWEVTSNFKEADFIIVSTCGFSQSEENHELQKIEEYTKGKKSDAEVVLTGCLPQINRTAVDKIFAGKYIRIQEMTDFNKVVSVEKKIEEFDNHFVSADEYNTDPKIHSYFRTRKRFEKLSFIPGVRVPKILYTVPSEKWFLIRCAMGCTGKCSYCGIKHAHGPIKSDPLDLILSQVRKGVAQGQREIALTGEDQGGYGFDIGLDLADLLSAILAVDSNFVVNLRYIDPFWLVKLKDKLMPIFATGRIKAFCSPIQSGSDQVLAQMKRFYSAREVVDTVNEVITKTKVGMISSNIIVGFPGETEEDFDKSVEVVEQAKFGMYMVFKYEDRPHTLASTYPNKISSDIIEKRYRILQKKIEARHLKYLLWG
ncbi:MAG: hypothetical protein A2451_05000 [Bdellovibrionales bacterium RIFOXYC2_FULL_39_8]|nr:MAG: hypothetical protein A2451_05000 [Bdellovibrionales bacterium RIFOXYC2_FULL_39_8]